MRIHARAGPRPATLALAAMLLFVSFINTRAANASTNVAPDHATKVSFIMVNPVAAEIILLRSTADNTVAIPIWIGGGNTACDALVSGVDVNQAIVGGTSAEPAVANNPTAWMGWWQNNSEVSLDNLALFMAPNTAGWQSPATQNGGQQGHRPGPSTEEGFIMAPQNAVAIFFGRQVPVGHQQHALFM